MLTLSVSESTRKNRTHGQILSKTLKLTTYPVVVGFFSPAFLESFECALKDGVRTDLFGFGVLSRAKDQTELFRVQLGHVQMLDGGSL